MYEPRTNIQENEIRGFTIEMRGAPIPARHPYRTKLVGVTYAGRFEGDKLLLSGSMSMRSGSDRVEQTPANQGVFQSPPGATREGLAANMHAEVKAGLVENHFPAHAVHRAIELRLEK